MEIKPNLFLIGGMRCGSTTLHQLLGQHPDIYMSKTKEPMFWHAEAERQAGTWQPGKRKYTTEDAYAALFADTASYRWRGESSHYLYFPAIPPLIARGCPDCRVVVSLRDPADRLFSEFLLRVRRGDLTTPFEAFAFADTERLPTGEIAAFGNGSRLDKGLQASLLEPWIAELGRERIKLIPFEDLQDRPHEVARELYRWLEIGDDFAPGIVHTQKGGVPRRRKLFSLLDRRGGSLRELVKKALPSHWRSRIRSTFYRGTLETPRPSRETMDILRAFYRSDIERLESLVGRDLSHWKTQAERP